MLGPQGRGLGGLGLAVGLSSPLAFGLFSVLDQSGPMMPGVPTLTAAVLSFRLRVSLLLSPFSRAGRECLSEVPGIGNVCPYCRECLSAVPATYAHSVA